MKKLIQFSLIAFFAFVSVSVFAQKDITDGKVQYEITQLDSDNPQAAMLKGTLISMFFKGDKQKMDIAMMGGMMRVQTIMDQKTPENSTVLMDMMGQKIHISDVGDEFKDKMGAGMMMPGKDGEKPEFDVAYNKKEKKEIAGYKCRQAVLTPKEGPAVTMYVTDKINPSNSQFKEMFEELNGFPLQISFKAEGVAVTLTATEVKPDVDAANFAVPEGYQKMTMEEFSKQMGGMMNMGGGN